MCFMLCYVLYTNPIIVLVKESIHLKTVCVVVYVHHIEVSLFTGQKGTNPRRQSGFNEFLLTSSQTEATFYQIELPI